MRQRLWLIVLLTLSCNEPIPRFYLDGVWSYTSGKFSYYYLVLHTHGNEIFGHACHESSGIMTHHDVPVRGDYPYLSYAVSPGTTHPCCEYAVGIRFVGRVTDSETIVGQWGRPDGENATFTYRRSSTQRVPAG